MSRIAVVTGGAGFIGGHLVEALAAEGWRVRIIDNLSTGKRTNVRESETVELIEADLRAPAGWSHALAGASTLFHLAALPSVQRSIEDPITTHEVNATGTLHALNAARDHGISRIVIASSSSVYGEKGDEARVETQPAEPISPYGVSKLAAEKYGLAFAAAYRLSVAALRFFNVYGPRQDPESAYAAVIPRFAASVLEGRPPVIFGDGHQSRDFTHVSDVVRGLLQAGTSDRVGYYNIAYGKQTSLLELVAVLSQVAGVAIEPQFEAARAGDIRQSYANIDAARRDLAFSPSVSVRDGLRSVWAYLQRHEVSV